MENPPPPPFPPTGPPPELDALEALRTFTSRFSRVRPASFPVEDAPGGFLAEEVESVPAGTMIPDESGPESTAPHALFNGFALPEGVRQGQLCRVLGVLSPKGPLDPEGGPPPGEPERPDAGTSLEGAAPGIWRVESGSPLPPGTWALLPVDGATLTGTRRIRVDRVPPRGHGMSRGRGGPSGVLAAPATFPSGTRFDARLRALLLARGVPTVRIRPPFLVGFATIGDELTDATAPREPGARHDLLGLTMEETVSSLGLTSAPFGIVRDDPAALWRMALRAREKGVQVLLLAGGLGNGVTDRTPECVKRLDAEIILHGMLFGGRAGILLARAHGMDLLALSGVPILAAAELDLLVVPALLARMGAPARRWDWAGTLLPLERDGSPRDRSSWEVQPASLRPLSGGGWRIRAWEPETPFLPVSAGQEGWAVIPPDAQGVSEGPEGLVQAYFQLLQT